MSSFLNILPSQSTLLSFYGSLSTLLILFRTILNELVPETLQDYISHKLSEIGSSWFHFSEFTFVIEERWRAIDNYTFQAAEIYLPTKVSPSTSSLVVGNDDFDRINEPPLPSIPVYGKIIDHYQGMRLVWTLHSIKAKKEQPEKRYFLLTCKKKHRDQVLKSYFPYISEVADNIWRGRETKNIYNYNFKDSSWEPTVFKHPSTFETIAMEPEVKQSILKDLDLFVKRKDYFKRVGRAWKRGYLLYGPPGTGKSSLVAAIANHLKYDIYDLQLAGVTSDSELRQILTSTVNRSVLLIEDIDCSTKVSHDRADDDEEDSGGDNNNKKETKGSGVTLSGLLNFVDGLWSCCGEERIIIFTTNHKDKLDAALLRPGRMDVHVYMGYCTPAGFRNLASTYLEIEHHDLFGSIEDLLARVEATPAEIAQQLMKTDIPQLALEGLIEFLSFKENEAKCVKEEEQLSIGEEEIISSE